MPTLTITRELGGLLTILQTVPNRALAHDFYSGGRPRFLLCKERAGEIEVISENTFMQLKKAKLIRQTRHADEYRWWWSWYRRTRCYLLSEEGKQFKLPPSEYWVNT